jgi:hypothetical protein
MRALARVSRYLSRDLWLVTMRDRVVTCSKRQFNICLLFIWLSNITPRLLRQPGVRDTHVTCEILGRLHTEIIQGWFLQFSRSNQRRLRRPLYKGRRPSVEAQTRIATDSSSSSQFSAPPLLCPAVPSSAVSDQGRAVSPNHHRHFDDLRGWWRIRFLGSASRTSAQVPLQVSWKSL